MDILSIDSSLMEKYMNLEDDPDDLKKEDDHKNEDDPENEDNLRKQRQPKQ